MCVCLYVRVFVCVCLYVRVFVCVRVCVCVCLRTILAWAVGGWFVAVGSYTVYTK